MTAVVVDVQKEENTERKWQKDKIKKADEAKGSVCRYTRDHERSFFYAMMRGGVSYGTGQKTETDGCKGA